jgi:Na+/H+ antiporter NhaC
MIRMSSTVPEQQNGERIRKWITISALVVVVALVLIFAAGAPPEEDQHIGFASVLPALCTLALVFITRNVVLSLFLGVAVGGAVSGQWNILDRFLLPAIGSSDYALILVVYLWALGGLIGLWTRTGGAQAFAAWMGSKIVRGPTSARVFAWLVGVIFHQGGTVSTVLAGTTVRPVSDAYRVSHEELTYVIDSTASPVATVIPFNAWPLYVGSLVVGKIALFPDLDSAVWFFFSSIPFNFYGIFAVMMTLLFSLGWLPWVGGKMSRAIERARTTGELNAAGAQPLASSELTEIRVPAGYRVGLEDFFVPMGVLFSVAIGSFIYTWIQPDLRPTVWIGEAFGLTVLSAFALAVLKGMKIVDAMGGFISGCQGVVIGAIILGLAVTLKHVSDSLGTASYIVELTEEIVQPVLLPAILLAICMAVAFSIGTSWGTYAVVFPLAMPLAYAVNPDPFFMKLCFGAVLGGAVFGDQCSPVSDTTILSSLACGGDMMDHVTTQIPLALTAAGLAAVLYTILAAMA